MRSANRGFTLLELLVSLFIAGILVGALTLRLGDSSEQLLKMEAKRLQALLQLAAEEAVLTSRELGLRLHNNGYVFAIYDNDRWQELGQDAQLRPRLLPAGIQLTLVLEGEAVQLSEQEVLDAASPQILIQSSGELTPFIIDLQLDKGRSNRLQLNVYGEIEWSDGA